MIQNLFSDIIADQTERALWEMKNVINCVPDKYWNKEYCNMPLWKHIYHMPHSLDLWLINSRDYTYQEPPIHEKDLNNLDAESKRKLSRDEITTYFLEKQGKMIQYINTLWDKYLLEIPCGSSGLYFKNLSVHRSPLPDKA